MTISKLKELQICDELQEIKRLSTMEHCNIELDLETKEKMLLWMEGFRNAVCKIEQVLLEEPNYHSRVRTIYHQRKAAGQCVTCGFPLKESEYTTKCEFCRKKHSEYLRQRYAAEAGDKYRRYDKSKSNAKKTGQ